MDLKQLLDMLLMGGRVPEGQEMFELLLNQRMTDEARGMTMPELPLSPDQKAAMSPYARVGDTQSQSLNDVMDRLHEQTRIKGR